MWWSYTMPPSEQMHVDTGLLEVLVTSLGDFDGRGSLATADTLGLTGDADGTATDTDLDEVGASSARKRKFAVDNVAGTDFHIVAVVLAHPFDGHLLPVRIALRKIDAQNVGASLDQSGNTLGVVAGVDARANQVALLVVEQLERVFLMGVVGLDGTRGSTGYRSRSTIGRLLSL